MDEAIEGNGGGTIDITPIVTAIQSLGINIDTMKTELAGGIASVPTQIATEVVTGMDKASEG